MSLRLKINLIVATVIAFLALTMIALQLDNVRSSVREEVVEGNLVASELLNRMEWTYTLNGPQSVLNFLRRLGRVRANEITLTDAAGRILYRSPPTTYKQGREAPAWFAALTRPKVSRAVIDLPAGRLTIEAEPSRAVLDGWDDMVVVAAAGVAALVLINLLVFWAVGRAVRPFSDIVVALNRLQAGDFETPLPPLPGKEAAAIGAAFNRMTGVLKENIENRQRAFQAEQRLSDSRELSRLIEEHIEAERREIARALHDELGQSVTAIRSLAMSVARRCENADAQSAQASRAIVDEAGRLYDHMHGMIPRLAPMTLATLGLGDALNDLIERVRASHPQVRLDLLLRGSLEKLPGVTALAAYRVAQEGITNALRHGRATHIKVTSACQAGELILTVRNNGTGLPEDWRRPGHFGLRWLIERVEALGGRLLIGNMNGGEVEVRAVLPFLEVLP